MPASLTNHASIALMASGGFTNQKTSARLNTHYNSVRSWRSHFLEALPHLRKVQESTPDRLLDEVRKIFSGRPRPGCPYVFTREQIMEIIDLAYKAPLNLGYEASQRSLDLFVREVRGQEITQDVSAKSISRFLKRNQIKTP